MADLEQERVTALWREAADLSKYAEWDERHDSPITPEQAREVAANWRDTTQLSNALDALAAECGRLREQLDVARQALGRIAVLDNGGGPSSPLHAIFDACCIARAALGVEGEQEEGVVNG